MENNEIDENFGFKVKKDKNYKNKKKTLLLYGKGLSEKFYHLV